MPDARRLLNQVLSYLLPTASAASCWLADAMHAGDSPSSAQAAKHARSDVVRFARRYAEEPDTRAATAMMTFCIPEALS